MPTATAGQTTCPATDLASGIQPTPVCGLPWAHNPQHHVATGSSAHTFDGAFGQLNAPGGNPQQAG